MLLVIALTARSMPSISTNLSFSDSLERTVSQKRNSENFSPTHVMILSSRSLKCSPFYCHVSYTIWLAFTGSWCPLNKISRTSQSTKMKERWSENKTDTMFYKLFWLFQASSRWARQRMVQISSWQWKAMFVIHAWHWRENSRNLSLVDLQWKTEKIMYKTQTPP